MAGLIDGIPTLCGGYDPQHPDYGFSTSCYQLNGKSMKLNSNLQLNQASFRSGYAQYKDKIIFTGGQRNFTIHTSWTGLISILDKSGQHNLGTLLNNTKIRAHCMVGIDTNTFMITGGTSNFAWFEKRAIVIKLSKTECGKGLYFGFSYCMPLLASVTKQLSRLST